MSANQATPYPELNAVLRALVEGVQAVLGQSFVAIYLQGSFAVGDFDEHSDVDFIVVVEAELTEAQVSALRHLHAQLPDQPGHWTKHLEGSYLPRATLRDLDQRGQPVWYVDHGSRVLIRSDHDNSLVVRSQVREHGVALAGPPPVTLIDPIPVHALRDEIMAAMHAWGRQIAAEPDRIHSRFYQAFAVLNFCRLLHDLHTGRVGSKRAGTKWAKAALDPSWAGLIDRAWDERARAASGWNVGGLPPDPEDFKSTLKFVAYILEASAPYAAALEAEGT